MPDDEVQHPLEQPVDERAPELDPKMLEELAEALVLPPDEPVMDPPEGVMTMPPDPVFVLNVNPDGADVIHRNPREECNTDDAVGRENVDARTAAAMIASGHARTCEHCIGPEEAHI